MTGESALSTKSCQRSMGIGRMYDRTQRRAAQVLAIQQDVPKLLKSQTRKIMEGTAHLRDPPRKRHSSDAAGSSCTNKKTPKKPRIGSGERNRNECLTWLREYAEEKRREKEAQREKAEQQHREKIELFSGMLNVLKDLKK